MEKIFDHTFEDKIWSIGYFRMNKLLRYWIEIIHPEGPRWYLLSHPFKELKPIEYPFRSTKNLKWFDSVGHFGIFLELNSSSNPGIDGYMVYDFKQNRMIEHQAVKQLDRRLIKQQIQQTLGLPENLISDELEMVSPQHYEENQSYFAEFKSFFEQKFQVEIAKGIDYLEYKDKLIFSYYLYDGVWKNKLLICDPQFNVLLNDELAQGDFMGYLTFQVLDRQLIYIKNKVQLISYELD